MNKIVQADVIGVNQLEFVAGSAVLNSRSVAGVVSDSTMSDLFTLVMVGMVILNTVNMGAQLDIQIIKDGKLVSINQQ